MSTKTKFDNLKFLTPPRNQGQMVTVSYASDDENGVLVERTERPDGPTTYRTADWDDSDMEGVAFEPWNAAPGVPEHMWEDVEGEPEAENIDTLYDSETNDALTADELGITQERYNEVVQESIAAGVEGHVDCDGRRVYAND